MFFVGDLFVNSRNVSVYLRVNSTYQCKLSAVYTGLATPVTVAFDELMHFDLTVDQQILDAYYFIRISVVAFDINKPHVRLATNIFRRITMITDKHNDNRFWA